jgi:aryl-alcohol dehydrogenase-like predicted oxidoreductase
MMNVLAKSVLEIVWKDNCMGVTFRYLGNSGLLVSSVGLGCNNFGRPDTPTFTADGTEAVLTAALDVGINFFDTADVYGAEYGLSEQLMGKTVASHRSSMVIATKFGHVDFESPLDRFGPGGSREYIRAAVDQSLERLQTDYIDLYQHHTPDPRVPIEVTLEALNELIAEGKVRQIGHSNYTAEQARRAQSVAKRLGLKTFVSAQNEYNLLTRGAETGILPAVVDMGLGFLPWFPLYNGLFTGNFSREGGPADSRIMRIRQHLHAEAPWDAMDAFADFCRERRITMLEATVGWLLAVPGMSSVIAGATTPEQVRENADAAISWSPSPKEFDTIAKLFPRAD